MYTNEYGLMNGRIFGIWRFEISKHIPKNAEIAFLWIDEVDSFLSKIMWD